MDDNIWEYPFGELDDDDDMFYREPESGKTSELFNRRIWPGISQVSSITARLNNWE
jgi:hypothetical protein